ISYMMNTKHNGFALSIVIWIIAALMLGISLLLAFAKENITAISDLEKKLQTQIAVEEVLEILKYYVMTADFQYITLYNNNPIKSKYTFPKKILLDNTKYPIGHGCSIELIDTSALLNVTYSSPNSFAFLATNKRQMRYVIIDSFLDWIDKDNFIRLNGAESNTYKIKYNQDYGTRDFGGIQDIEEIRLIQGFNKLNIDEWNYVKSMSYTGLARLPNILLMSESQFMNYLDISSLQARELIEMRTQDMTKFFTVLKKNKTYDDDLFVYTYSSQLRIKITSNMDRASSILNAIISFEYDENKAITVIEITSS
ncbi:MAG: hypothetical protein U9R50_01420, partial [Campylobacterota bacterium]|nr:hypothetical protein [Campylobacterota bacterium]